MHRVEDLVRNRIAAPYRDVPWARGGGAISVDPADERRFGTGMGFGLLLSVPFWLGIAAVLLH